MKKSLQLMIFILAALMLQGRLAAEPAAIIQDENGCKVYNPAPQENETIRWSGDCIDGFANGFGILEWFIGGQLAESYEGDMEAGWAHGRGVLISQKGMRYEGSWKKSVQNGYGTASSTDGSSYEGDWLDGKPHGRGTYTHPNGDIMSGEWQNGKLMEGTGAQKI